MAIYLTYIWVLVWHAFFSREWGRK
jgi:hypothetical protein